MRVLLCSPAPLTRRLGAAKVPIELGDALRAQGADVDVVGPDALAADGGLAARLRRSRYDVVDAAYWTLPTDRAALPPEALVVARVPLLGLHVERAPLPRGPRTLRRLLTDAVKGRARDRAERARLDRAAAAFRAADLTIVNNRHDREALLRDGLGPVGVTALGLSRGRLAALAADPDRLADPPVVAFVGTFDWRKGAADFPAIVGRVAAAVPDVRFRLLGTRGLFPTDRAVRRQFPRALRRRLEIVPTFDPDDLPALLRGCRLGVFPSYLEGFGFGVLEMMAASLPVVAYDAPGPPEMVAEGHLVPPGDAAAMADVVVGWLRDPDALRAERRWAAERAGAFTWDRVAEQTLALYEAARAALPPAGP